MSCDLILNYNLFSFFLSFADERRVHVSSCHFIIAAVWCGPQDKTYRASYPFPWISKFLNKGRSNWALVQLKLLWIFFLSFTSHIFHIFSITFLWFVIQAQHWQLPNAFWYPGKWREKNPPSLRKSYIWAPQLAVFGTLIFCAFAVISYHVPVTSHCSFHMFPCIFHNSAVLCCFCIIVFPLPQYYVQSIYHIARILHNFAFLTSKLNHSWRPT